MNEPLRADVHIATSSYSAYLEADGIGVKTSVGKPRFTKPGMTHTCNELAPYGLLRKPPLPADEFRAGYWQRLDTKADDIERFLAGLPVGSTAVLLCWCTITSLDPTTPDGECHRRMAADWFLVEHGVVVPELTLPHLNHAHSHPLGRVRDRYRADPDA